MTHTPGPWVVQGQDVITDRPYPHWKQLATVRIGSPRDWSDPEGTANANLIAAAPELLAALKDAYAALDYAQAQVDSDDDRMHLTRCRRKIKPIIAKAEGGSE